MNLAQLTFDQLEIRKSRSTERKNPESNLYFALKQILRKNPEKFTHHNDTLALERGGKSPTRVGVSNHWKESQLRLTGPVSWWVVGGRIPQLK